MSKERPSRLYYTGDGAYFFAFAPARDLDEGDVAALDDEQVKALLSDQPPDGKPLYQASRPAGRGQEAAAETTPAEQAAPEPPAKRPKE